VLGSTEDVWTQQFQQGRLPNYGAQAGAYQHPTLVVFTDAVETGCGVANSQVGPFYCPADRNLYIDPTFYQQMESQLRAPGDFAQAYVIAHEVGHHVQNLIGATQRQVSGETQNQTSVRVELQADCLAGVWGHTARANLAIDEADLREALNAAHAIGDDTLGARETQYTHGTSAQRMTWFRRGFDSGDARQCDTFAVRDYRAL
jgi:predicted metalloprotease